MKFLTNKPACVIGEKLVISELHFGIELDLQRRGVNTQLSPHKYASELNKLKTLGKATELLVLGDFKHTITGFDQRERNAFNEFIHGLHFKKITVVKGNHDSRLEEMASPFPHFEVFPASGMCFKHGKTTYGAFHGHANPSSEVLKADVLLVGHNHAGIQIGKGDFAKTLSAWVIAPFAEHQKLISFPSFNPLSGAMPFNAVQQKELHGPIFKDNRLDLKNAEVVLLSGQRLGKLKHLQTN
ncbi:hypothetical protein HY571_00410 [Candidatus Micrarchaeota archaeon]|nr:hypothetical protein [Candidatus Micrarchaeota archaeon]